MNLLRHASGFAAWLRGRLGRVVVASYAAALVLPLPGLWLRRPHALVAGDAGLAIHVPPVLLGTLLFSAGFQIRFTALRGLLRRPYSVVAALGLRLALPLVLIPVLVVLLRQTPDSDHGSGIITSLVLIMAMPVAANATVWTAKGEGDQPTMVATVLGSTVLSPLTTPLLIGALALLLPAHAADALSFAATAAGNGVALSSIVLPCAAGFVLRSVLPAARGALLGDAFAAVALLASVVTTYINASSALAPCLAHPRPLLIVSGIVVAATMCGASFLLGHVAGAALRLSSSGRSSLALACGMSNSSAGAVLISAAVPSKPYLLLPVLVYGLVQKSAANLVVRRTRPLPSLS
ncbi:sodium-dependent transporter [Streptomyces sp. HUAS MG91]|uniref:Sodium-dependent transporter n=1 Tax=Streptomyces tabacisoli TaxID=3156398 RepID=A0AAU8IKW8_9ACTN